MTSISIENLEFSYPNGPRVLSIPSLKIEENEKVFLKGPSGSGKTTLLNIIGGVLSSYNGKIKIQDTDFSSLSSRQKDQFRADNMGFIFQNLNLIPYLSPLENVTLALSFSDVKTKRIENPQKEAIRLLEALGIEPKDYKKKHSISLSQGQQQRVAVARACMGSPKLIIADEPTSALDADNRIKFLDLLNSMASKMKASVLFVSHDSQLEGEFDRVINLKDINQVGGVD